MNLIIPPIRCEQLIFIAIFQLNSKAFDREMNDLRKLLLVYRMIHYGDQIPDVQLSIKNRDKLLCCMIPTLNTFR
jgi:hypothetical protein